MDHNRKNRIKKIFSNLSTDPDSTLPSNNNNNHYKFSNYEVNCDGSLTLVENKIHSLSFIRPKDIIIHKDKNITISENCLNTADTPAFSTCEPNLDAINSATAFAIPDDCLDVTHQATASADHENCLEATQKATTSADRDYSLDTAHQGIISADPDDTAYLTTIPTSYEYCYASNQAKESADREDGSDFDCEPNDFLNSSAFALQPEDCIFRCEPDDCLNTAITQLDGALVTNNCYTATIFDNSVVNLTAEPENNFDTSNLSFPSSPSILAGGLNAQETRKHQSEEPELEDIPKRKRSKKRDEKTWLINENKERREKGKKYKGRKKEENKWIYDKTKEERKIKPRCHCKLSSKQSKFECAEVEDAKRLEIFNKFWSMTWKEKKMYVKTLTVVKPTQRKRTNNEISRRNKSLELYLEVDSIKTRVCKTMFLNTLAIGEWTLLNWTRNGGDNELYTDENERTKQNENRISKKEESVENFFDDLPKLESHYCRSQTSKLYLETIWESKSQLLREYNEDYCKNNDCEPVSITTLSKVFDRKNLAFFLPKKDMCDLCEAFKCKNISENEYNKHISMKNAARKEKESDKNSGKEVLTMDLQSVLLCPKSNVSALYYKTKLAVHNFTVYDIKRSEGYCFIWNETEGSLTANEFSSIVIRMLELFVQKHNLKEGSEIIIYSDGCTYQNRNATLANALLNFAVQTKITIVQKILEKGHTQMEADSMHSVMERQIRKKKINVPADYVHIAQTACTKKPYNVEYLDHTFFRNFEDVLKAYKSIRPGKKAGDPVVTNLRQLKYLPDGNILYKLGFTENDEEKPLPYRVKLAQPVQMQDLPRLYTDRLKIKKSKFDHLQQLKLTMEKDYHAFYDAIPYE